MSWKCRIEHRRPSSRIVNTSVHRPNLAWLFKVHKFFEWWNIATKITVSNLSSSDTFLRIWMFKVSMLLCNWQLWTFEWCFSNLGIQSSYLFSFNFDVQSFNTLQFTALEVRVNCCGSVKKAKKVNNFHAEIVFHLRSLNIFWDLVKTVSNEEL